MHSTAEVLIFRFRRLESRLLASFLLLAAIPSLLLSWIATDRIRGALDRLHIPGLEESLSTSAIMGAELVDRLNREADVIVTDLGTAIPLGDDERIRSEVLEARGFDFLVHHAAAGTQAVMRFQGLEDVVGDAGVAADSRGLPTADEWRLLESGERPPLLREGTLRFFRRAPTGEGHLALGIFVSDEVARALSASDDTLARYLQLTYFVDIQKKIVWLSWGAIFLLTAAGAFVAARITARRIGRPVGELSRAADRLAAGELDHRANVRAEGEIGHLVDSFNRMAQEIERSRADLLRAERIAAWREVAQRIAHEIRNPLTPVRLAVHRLRGRLTHDEAAQGSLQAIAEEVENLTRLAETFSEFAKLPEPKFERVDLARVAESVVKLAHAGVPEGTNVTLESVPGLFVRGDPDHLRRAITNLVKNAIEATQGGMREEGDRGTRSRRVETGERQIAEPAREGDRATQPSEARRPPYVPHVLVRTSVVAEGARRRARVEVIDNGPGVPEEMREMIFRPGFTTKSGGSGLGLALVHRIARDHEGTLRLGRGVGGTGGAKAAFAETTRGLGDAWKGEGTSDAGVSASWPVAVSDGRVGGHFVFEIPLEGEGGSAESKT